MRIELAGSLVHPLPLIVKFDSDQDFDPSIYMNLGFTNFDVICIGGGGGMGGGIDTGNTGTTIRSYGGAGGGGGFHRVQGLLSALSTPCSVVVGDGGNIGTEDSSDPFLTTNGEDGGASSFNGSTCLASGGEGGKRVTTNSLTDDTLAHGGDGGVGNRSPAGGGGAGGDSGASSGFDGTFFNNVGKGGGGGAGGVGTYDGVTHVNATSGGRGSYNPGDMSVYGPGDAPGNDPNSGALSIIPGGASGAKASPLSGLPTIFGRSKGDLVPGDKGVVILRLTAE